VCFASIPSATSINPLPSQIATTQCGVKTSRTHVLPPLPYPRRPHAPYHRLLWPCHVLIGLACMNGSRVPSRFLLCGYWKIWGGGSLPHFEEYGPFWWETPSRRRGSTIRGCGQISAGPREVVFRIPRKTIRNHGSCRWFCVRGSGCPAATLLTDDDCCQSIPETNGVTDKPGWIAFIDDSRIVASRRMKRVPPSSNTRFAARVCA